MEDNRITVTGIAVSDQFCRDIMVTCVEGGSNYWAMFRNIVRDDDLDILSFDVVDAEAEIESAHATWYHVDEQTIRAGVARTFDTTFKVADRIRGDILADNMDSESSDVVLQAALFGEIVYG